MEVYTWYGRIKENQDVILTAKWWETVRYHNFGSALKIKFTEKPELLK